MTTIVVAGAIANKPGSGGEAWVRLSWAEGLRRLGFDVWLVEHIDPASCVGADGRPALFERSVNRTHFEAVVAEAGWQGRAALLPTAGPQLTTGVDRATVTAAAADAALLVNISGHLRLPALLHGPRQRAYVDIDPGFTQIWHEQGADLGLAGHEHHFTIGVNIGRHGCPVPTGGFDWQPVHQPVVLDDWPVLPCGRHDRFTTIGNWRGPYGPLTHGGRSYGLKHHEFRKLAALPRRVQATFEAALAIHPGDEADRRLLLGGGWTLTDPSELALPGDFRRYVQASGAEVSAAQGVYVGTGSGWFSDRSVRYLASGRPVLVQDTGFGRSLPVGAGIVTFSDLDGAAAGAARILDDWSTHAAAARAIAQEKFAHDVVLPSFLGACGIS